MSSFEIISTVAPEYDPSRTTGDGTSKTSLVVEWVSKPTDNQLRKFEAKYPPHIYSAFHFAEGVGKVQL